jgi:putative pyruvate formate lyase activating enzyme
LPSAPSFTPAYLDRLRSGTLDTRVEEALDHLTECDLCPRYCRVDRRDSFKGALCHTAAQTVVHSYGRHHGEEDPLRGTHGSGTIFFSWCNLRCVYCQNWDISQKEIGREVSADELAGMMLELQVMGYHNINLVSPSHVVAQVISAVAIAANKGLQLPLVYNTGGYDSLEALRLLEGIVDIYMPDMKYADPETARCYSRARDYVTFNRAAVKEMHRQVGDLVLDKNGIARRGLLVRHLVLPGDLAGTAELMEFLAREVSADTYVNLMDQYRPCYRAERYSPLDRSPKYEEYEQALATARRAGLHRFDQPR